MNIRMMSFSSLLFAASLTAAASAQAARLDLWGAGASVEVADCVTNHYGECTSRQGNWQTVHEETNLRSRYAEAAAYNAGTALATVGLATSIDQLQDGMSFLTLAIPMTDGVLLRSSAWFLQGFRYQGDGPASLTIMPHLGGGLLYAGYTGQGVIGLEGEMQIYDADALEAAAGNIDRLPDPVSLGVQPLAEIQARRQVSLYDPVWAGEVFSPLSLQVRPGDDFYLWLRVSAYASDESISVAGTYSTAVGPDNSGSLGLVFTGGPISILQPPEAGTIPAPVPLPGAIWLALGGLAGLIAVGRRA